MAWCYLRAARLWVTNGRLQDRPVHTIRENPINKNQEFLPAQVLEIRKKERKRIVFVTHDPEEVIVLGERHFALSVRPAHIIEEITVTDYRHEEHTIETNTSQVFIELRNRLFATTQVHTCRAKDLLFGGSDHGTDGSIQ